MVQKTHQNCIISCIVFPLLLQIDMQSDQKEKERLRVENEGMKCDLERLQEENKALKASLSKQGPPEGDKSDTKVLKMCVFKNDLTYVLISYACIC